MARSRRIAATTAALSAVVALALAGCGKSESSGEATERAPAQMQAAAPAQQSGRLDTMSVLSYWFNLQPDTMRAPKAKTLRLRGANQTYTFIVDGKPIQVQVAPKDTVDVDLSGWTPGNYTYHVELPNGKAKKGVIAVDSAGVTVEEGPVSGGM